MTLPEYFLFVCGATCLVVFLFRTLAPFFRSLLDRTAESTARSLREDFLSLSQRQVRGILIAAGAIMALASVTVTRGVFWTLAVGSSPLLLCGIVVRRLHARRQRRIVSQLPGFLEILSGHVKAGHSIPESLQGSVPFLPAGIREEAQWLCRSIRLGTSLPDALRLWEQRMACGEVSLIVRPLGIAIPAGGNLYDLLTRCRDMLRAKMHQEEKMRSMTAQARLQAFVLTLLPPAFIAVLSRIEPGYLSRCRETSIGKILLATAAALQLLGWLSIRRILAGIR